MDKSDPDRGLLYPTTSGRQDEAALSAPDTPLMDRFESKAQPVKLDEQAVEEQTEGKTVGQKFKDHMKRFWMFYLVGMIVFLVIFIPILILKIIPAVAQGIVTRTDIALDSATFQALSNDQLEISMKTSMALPKAISVKLDAFELDMYNPETIEGFYPYMSVSIPSMTLSGTTPISIDKQTVMVRNHTELNKMFKGAFNNHTISVSVRSKVVSHLGPVKIPLLIEKTLEIPGLDKLQGLSLDSTQILIPAQPDGTNLVGQIIMPNPSILSIGLGNLTMTVLVGDLNIGYVDINNVVLNPGQNNVTVTGQIYVDTLTKNIGTVLSSQSSALSTGMLEVGVTGNKTTYNGEHLSYLEATLANSTLTTKLPIANLLGDLTKGITGGNITFPGLANLLGDAVKSSLAPSAAPSTARPAPTAGSAPTPAPASTGQALLNGLTSLVSPSPAPGTSSPASTVLGGLANLLSSPSPAPTSGPR